ncbi:MAG TPA: SRPBCC domain-containing protein [Chitinophagaceae bacterium]|nr:SRPBCC domain-containing protein [Chitinophagaceae bacterium]
MKTIYNINKEAKQIIVERSFSASKDLVWDAYTKSKILEQWWAPNPYYQRDKFF